MISNYIHNIYLKFLNLFKVYSNPYILAVMFLGFSSGLPLGLTGMTLDAMLKDAGVTKAAIGLFAIVGIPYSLKFFWAPLMDRLSIPFLTAFFGRRSSWIILTQILLVVFIILLGSMDFKGNLWNVALVAFCLSFCSASQDIVIDAYRVEILEEKEQGAGAGAATFGYIIAMKMISGALALFMSDIFGWKVTYLTMAAFMGVGILTVIVAGEPKISGDVKINQHIGLKKYIDNLLYFINSEKGVTILLFIVFYKLGDAFIGKMTMPFLQEIGFNNSEIALYLKTFGLFATLFGTFAGGIMVYYLKTHRTLFIAGILQMVSNLVFIIQYYVGHNAKFLSVTVVFENLSAGIGTSAFVAYISSLCNVKYTASQYALFSSFAVIGRTWISSFSGYYADYFGWNSFFIFGTIIAIPGILLLFKIPEHGNVKEF